MRRYKSFLVGTLLFVQAFSVILHSSLVFGTSEMQASPSQFGLINVALTKNVAPRSDWSNGTLYHLRILQKFVPINITVITNFTKLSSYQFLFLNMLNISDADIATIADWVNDGGSLVSIGQSGQYTETGEERTAHPLATVLGITLDGWERTSGAEVRKVITNVAWHWWSSGGVYDTANNGDGLYHEEVDIYYIPKSECANVTLIGATQIMSCRDRNIASYFPPFPTFPTYEEPLLTNNTYGSGKAFFFTSDAFYRLVWKPPKENFGMYRNENALVGGYWFRSGLLWQILYAIFLDCFSGIPLPIITSMPNGFSTAMSFGLKTVGFGIGKNDTADDCAYGNLTQYWKPQLFDKHPNLQGWFWGFWLMTRIINGTTNATNIVDFVKEYGYAGSRSHVAAWTLQNYATSSEVLRKHGFEYNYEGSAGGTVIIQDLTTLARKWNFTDIFYLRRISGRPEHGGVISSVPTPISNHTGIVNFFAQPYAVEMAGSQIEWRLLIEAQKTLGENYGIGGYCMGDTYAAFIGSIPNMEETINMFINDSKVWKTSGQLFVDWWDKRWQVNMTDFSANSSQITLNLQTPDIQNLTLLIKNMPNPYLNIIVDGTPLTPLPESDRIVIPQLSKGAHSIVIKLAKIFGTPELKEYNDQLKADGKPYIVNSTHLIDFLDYTNQRLSLTLDLPINASAELKVHSSYPIRQVFANGQAISFTHSNTTDIAAMLTPYAHVDIYCAQPKIMAFSSSKPTYDIYESVDLTLKIYGDYSASEIIEWVARVTVLDEAKDIVNTTSREIGIGKGATLILNLSMGRLPTGVYNITAEILDPEAGNILAINKLTIRVPFAFLGTLELKEYNDQLKADGKPYIVNSTHLIDFLNYTNQRLSLTLDLPINASAELKVHSLYSPRKVFASGQSVSFAYGTNITTMMLPYAFVDIYYAQPEIRRFSSSRLEYRINESISLNLEIYGDHSTSDPLRLLARLTVKNEKEDIVQLLDREIETSMASAQILYFAVKNLSQGIYEITAEIVDPDANAKNILASNSLTISVTEIPMAPTIFDTVKLREYNEELRSKGLPYIEESTQPIVELAFSSSYQRLSITLDVHSGIYTELKVYSSYPPCQAFANGQPISFRYSADITTILVLYADVDIYYAQPEIAVFSSPRLQYETGESVDLTLKIYGNYSTLETAKWLARITVENETEKIVKTAYEEIELNTIHIFIMKEFSEGTYTIMAEIIDPETENILETRSLTIKVNAGSLARIVLSIIIATTVTVATIGAAVYAWYRLKKSKFTHNETKPVSYYQ